MEFQKELTKLKKRNAEAIEALREENTMMKRNWRGRNTKQVSITPHSTLNLFLKEYSMVEENNHDTDQHTCGTTNTFITLF